MKKTITRILSIGFCALGLVMSMGANAQTYTAISSGAWSSTAIWSGGNAPGNSVGLLESVVINSGITVTLDEDVDFNLGSSLVVDGTLQSGSNTNMLTITAANISGDGMLDLNRLSFGTAGTMTFTGTAMVDKMWTSATSLQLASDFTLEDSLFMDAGTLNLNNGSNFTFGTDAGVQVDNGSFTATAGVLNNSNPYTVTYVGSSKTIGLEMAGTAISDIYLNMDDNTQSLSIAGNAVINGNLHHNSGMLDLNGGSLSINGDYMAMSGAMIQGSSTSNLTINTDNSLSSDLMFDPANNEMNNVTINVTGGNSVNFGNDMMLNGTLTLEEGDMMMTSGTLMLASGSEIEVQDGRLMLGGTASFDGSNDYAVTYTSSESMDGGIELTGSGLSDLTIDFENEDDSLAVMNDLTLDGMLDLTNGGMGMAGHSLTLNGTLNTSSNAWISGDEDSDLTFNTSTLTGDTLWFNPESNHVGMITINAQDNSDLMIGNDVMVEGMTMSTGGVQLWDNQLWVETTGTITGASSDRYVMIDGNGGLVMNVNVASPYMMYPVGTSSGFAPISLQQNSGSDVGFFMVSTMDGVWDYGMSGTDLSTTQSVVNRTWLVESMDSTTDIDMNLMAMWDASMEMNSFDRTDASLVHYTNGNWDLSSTSGSAATTVGSMFAIERTGFTSLSPFAVADQNSALKITENTELLTAVYPNPVKTILNCEVALDENTTARVIDPTGKVVMTQEIIATGSPVLYTIDFTNYNNGIYFVTFDNGNGTSSYRVVKN